MWSFFLLNAKKKKLPYLFIPIDLHCFHNNCHQNPLEQTPKTLCCIQNNIIVFLYYNINIPTHNYLASLVIKMPLHFIFNFYNKQPMFIYPSNSLQFLNQSVQNAPLTCTLRVVILNNVQARNLLYSKA